MPSNQIPEDLRAELKRKLAYELCTQWPPCADHEEAAGAAIDAIAPLIIEWARKDQAEADERLAQNIAQSQFDKGRNDVAFGANQVREAIANQFAGETGGQ